MVPRAERGTIVGFGGIYLRAGGRCTFSGGLCGVLLAARGAFVAHVWQCGIRVWSSLKPEAV